VRQEHGEPGHLNIYTRDQDSVITGYGTHWRVVAFLPDCEGLYCRVDAVHGPRAPTPDEILRVARLDQGVRGKWKLNRVEDYPDGKSTEYHFIRPSPPMG
jgi:hypothetical protein